MHSKIYFFLKKISKFQATIDRLIEESQILEKENRLDKYLCYVLVTELMFGAQKLNGESKPVVCVSSYLDRFNEILADNKGDNQSENADASHNCEGKIYRECNRPPLGLN